MFKAKLFTDELSLKSKDYTQFSVIDDSIISTPENAIIALFHGTNHIELFIESGAGDNKCIERYYIARTQWTKNRYAYKSEPKAGQRPVYRFTSILEAVATAKEAATWSRLFEISSKQCQVFRQSLNQTEKPATPNPPSALTLGTILSMVHSSYQVALPKDIEFAFSSIGISISCKTPNLI